VDTTSTESLAAGLRKLLTDRPGYETLFQQARDRRYSNWAQYWEKLCHLIKFKTAGGDHVPETRKIGPNEHQKTERE